MSEKRRGHGHFGTAAKKTSKGTSKVVQPEEYEDGDKPFAKSERSSAQPVKPISSKPRAPAQPAATTSGPEGTQYDEVPAKVIRSWKLKDRTLAELDDDPEYAELVKSVRSEGVIEPLVVRRLTSPDSDGHRFEEIAGFKRLNAALTKSPETLVPILIRELDDQTALRIQKNENVGRSLPSAWSRALHYKALLDEGVYSSQSQLADALELNKATLSNLMRAANGIPEDLRKSLKLHLVGVNSLIHMLSRLSEVGKNDSEAFIDRLVEFADEFNDRPEKAISTIDKAWSSMFEQSKSVFKPVVYQSQKGKTLSIKPSGNSLSVTLHSAALEVASQEEITKVVTDYLNGKGLSLEEKKNKK